MREKLKAKLKLFFKDFTDFSYRWIFSTNHKDIGILYLLFAIGAGFVGLLLDYYYYNIIIIIGFMIFSISRNRMSLFTFFIFFLILGIKYARDILEGKILSYVLLKAIIFSLCLLLVEVLFYPYIKEGIDKANQFYLDKRKEIFIKKMKNNRFFSLWASVTFLYCSLINSLVIWLDKKNWGQFLLYTHTSFLFIYPLWFIKIEHYPYVFFLSMSYLFTLWSIAFRFTFIQKILNENKEIKYIYLRNVRSILHIGKPIIHKRFMYTSAKKAVEKSIDVLNHTGKAALFTVAAGGTITFVSSVTSTIGDVIKTKTQTDADVAKARAQADADVAKARAQADADVAKAKMKAEAKTKIAQANADIAKARATEAQANAEIAKAKATEAQANADIAKVRRGWFS